MTPRRRILPVFVPHAGCPNDCVFCNQKRISGSLQPASGANVRETLLGLPEGCGVELAFYGGSFTAIPPCEQEALLSAAQPFRAVGTVAAIRVSTRPDSINSEALNRLRQYGVATIELGTQSMDNDVLRASGRGHTAEDTIKAAAAVKNAGFKLILQMMTGLPGSTPDKDIETAEKIIALHPDGVRIYPTVIIKDTELADLWQKGEYREHTVEDAVELCSGLLPMFQKADIPVIRLGLNPTDELSGGAVLGGAYHPALGDMVRSRIRLQRIRELIGERSQKDKLTIFVHPSKVSETIGQHRCNIVRLQKEYHIRDIQVKAAGCGPEEIRLLWS